MSSSLRVLARMAYAMDGSGSWTADTGPASFVGQSIAGEGVLQLRHRADVARVQFGNRSDGLSHQAPDVRQTLVDARPEVDPMFVVLQNTGAYLEIGNSSCERIGHGLENVKRQRLLILDLAGDFVPAEHLRQQGSVIHRSGQVVHHEVEQPVRADILISGGAQHRPHAPLFYRLLKTFDNMCDRQRALLEELFEKCIVAFGHHFHQRLMSDLRLIRHVGGNLAFLALPVTAWRIAVALHADQIDDAAEALLRADRELDGNSGAAEGFMDARQRAIETRARRGPGG